MEKEKITTDQYLTECALDAWEYSRGKNGRESDEVATQEQIEALREAWYGEYDQHDCHASPDDGCELCYKYGYCREE